MKSYMFFELFTLILFSNTSGKIVPSKENDSVPKSFSNSDNTPLEVCREHMSLFPENENSTKWICDCSEDQFLYFAEDDSCYQAYMRGPCLPAHYLVLHPGEQLAKCEKNPCKEDGLVPYEDVCAALGQPTKACFRRGFLVVSPVTFQLECVFNRIFNVIKAPRKMCPPGSRRTTFGSCKHVL